MGKVYFHNLENTAFLKERGKLKRFLLSLFKKEKKKLKEIHFIFCSDAYLLNINQKHLQHDFLTDIITFDLSESEEITAEIYISVDRLKENAKTFHVSFLNEAHRLVFHGSLHLCGYKDKTKKEKEEMRAKEDHYLQTYTLA
jgi:probable rRNA maturation factor